MRSQIDKPTTIPERPHDDEPLSHGVPAGWSEVLGSRSLVRNAVVISGADPHRFRLGNYFYAAPLYRFGMQQTLTNDDGRRCTHIIQSIAPGPAYYLEAPHGATHRAPEAVRALYGVAQLVVNEIVRAIDRDVLTRGTR